MNVLIVDDEVFAVNATMHRVDWASLGFDAPLTANSMKQAQTVFLATTVDLLLCDIEMPQGSGLDLFEWVKTYYPKTECIFVTCHDEYDYLRAAMQLGSCDYVLKPVDYEQLYETLEKVVERCKARSSREITARKTAVAVPVTSSENPYIAGILSYISEHLSEQMAIGDIADTLHLNPQYVMRLFKKEVGCSILQYITAKRIGLAVRLLDETSLSVTDVAAQAGFDNYSYFTRIFKRFTNDTPSSYRKASARDM